LEEVSGLRSPRTMAGAVSGALGHLEYTGYC